MEVHFTPETEKKLKHLAAQSGRGTDDLVEDALAGYFAEVLQVREMLNSRYHDLKSGKVKPIPGDKVEAYFREKSAAVRRRSNLVRDRIRLSPRARIDLDEIWEFARIISTPPTGSVLTTSSRILVDLTPVLSTTPESQTSSALLPMGLGLIGCVIRRHLKILHLR